MGNVTSLLFVNIGLQYLVQCYHEYIISLYDDEVIMKAVVVVVVVVNLS